MDLRFRLFGTHIRVHPLFWVIAAALGWMGGYADSHVLPGGGVGDLALWVGCVFLSILLHEFGHVWMGRLFRTDGHIVLYSMGGLAVGSNDVSSRWKRILVSFAGPGIQLVLWAALLGLLLLGVRIPRGSPLELMLEILLVINLWWAVLNLLPIWPLDGGMIMREICTGISPARGLLVSLWISLVVAAVISINSLLGYYKQQTIPYIPRGGLFTAVMFAMFAIDSLRAIQYESSVRRGRYSDDELPWER